MDTIQFDRSAAVSALIKSMRFGDYQEAADWFVALIENGVEGIYLAKRFSIFAAEDCFEPELIILANSIHQMYAMKIGNHNMLWQLLYRCCKAKKFWESDEGQEYEIKAGEAIAKYKLTGVKPIPKWAVDKHTKLYYKLLDENKESDTDLRFSGDDIGRLHMILMYRKYGRVSPDIIDDELYEKAKKQCSETW